ncbi:MAG: hypothetical protein V5B78_06185 [Desulfohalobiaceae bacterium]
MGLLVALWIFEVGYISCFIRAGKKQMEREATYEQASDEGKHLLKPPLVSCHVSIVEKEKHTEAVAETYKETMI